MPTLPGVTPAVSRSGGCSPRSAALLDLQQLRAVLDLDRRPGADQVDQLGKALALTDDHAADKVRALEEEAAIVLGRGIDPDDRTDLGVDLGRHAEGHDPVVEE